MADVKISQLPLATAVHADDTLEKSDHNAAPSQRCTPLQIMTYLQTAFPSLSWASGVSNLQPNGDIFVGAGNLAIINAADGSASFGATKIQLNSDGSAAFATGQIIMSSTGGLTLVDGLGVGSSNTVLNADGSANIANGTCQIAIDGSLTVDNGFGSIKLNASNGSLEMDNATIDGAGGSASFANGSCTIGANGTVTADDGGSGGIALNATTAALEVATTKVVGAQGAPVADATTAVDVIARFNELLARVRASTGHGLISG